MKEVQSRNTKKNHEQSHMGSFTLDRHHSDNNSVEAASKVPVHKHPVSLSHSDGSIQDTSSNPFPSFFSRCPTTST